MHERLQEIHKQLIETVRRGLQKHEDSWVETPEKPITKGHYTRSQEDCFKEAAEEVGLPEGIWYLIYLANHWTNDLQDWCDQMANNGTLNGWFSSPEEDKPEVEPVRDNA